VADFRRARAARASRRRRRREGPHLRGAGGARGRDWVAAASPDDDSSRHRVCGRATRRICH